ncbi:MAG: hypothetical protein IJV70_01640 [Clostridia bacterium]|nr:hypothetical protein [Clostridia bacterium]
METDNIDLLKQTYEYKFYSRTKLVVLVVACLMLVPLLVLSIMFWDFANVGIPLIVVLGPVFTLCVFICRYQIKELLKYPETYSRVEATVVDYGYSNKSHYLTVCITKSKGKVFEINTKSVFSYFKAKALVGERISVLYNTFDKRIAVIDI